jgi:hypothetical protein
MSRLKKLEIIKFIYEKSNQTEIEIIFKMKQIQKNSTFLQSTKSVYELIIIN